MSRPTHGLFAHGTLVRVTRRLVVMWIRNQASADAEYCKRLNLQMSCVTKGTQT